MKRFKLAKLILILNIVTPFSLGTFIYVCYFEPKDANDYKKVKNQLSLIISSFALIIVGSIMGGIGTLFIMAAAYMALTYIWGIVIAVIIFRRVRKSLIEMNMNNSVI